MDQYFVHRCFARLVCLKCLLYKLSGLVKKLQDVLIGRIQTRKHLVGKIGWKSWLHTCCSAKNMSNAQLLETLLIICSANAPNKQLWEHLARYVVLLRQLHGCERFHQLMDLALIQSHFRFRFFYFFFFFWIGFK